MFDKPENNDNRQYNFSQTPDLDRVEYPIITSFVPEKSKIIDLGCGNGSLMQKLQKEKNCQVAGVELSESGVEVCQKKGLDVIQGSIDEKMPFEENSFDISICNVTLQMVMYPEVLMQEMKRIARYQIISFPNFGYYKNRLELLFTGRMPKKMLFGYEWYNTGHIHQLGIPDFLDMTRKMGLRVVNKQTTATGLLGFMSKISENCFSPISIYKLQK